MTEPIEPTFTKSTVREYFESLVITVILALFGTTFIVQAFKIPTESMEDNLLVGDHLLVNKFAFGARGSILDRVLPLRDIHRGDVIVFKYPNDLSKNYVKRAIGLPGDHLRTVKDHVYINGEPLKEPYKVYYKRPRGSYVDPKDYFPPKSNFPVFEGSGDPFWYEKFVQGDDIVVPENQYFAMGDNRDNSADSRYWGFVSRDLIVGKALVIYWSYETTSAVETSSGKTATQTLDVLSNFFRKTRWGRTFRLIR
jgi:signal peptidase I